MTKQFTYAAAQGDVLIRRIDNIPDGLTPAEIVSGKHVVAHSETGHHHVIDSKQAQLLIDKTNEFIAYLHVTGSAATLDHERPYDTHESIALAEGNYEVRRQREYVPQGFRRAAD
jgi:hypothetical protein